MRGEGDRLERERYGDERYRRKVERSDDGNGYDRENERANFVRRSGRW